MSSRFVTGGSFDPSIGGKRTLSRFVSLSSRPPTDQSPSFGIPARASSSSDVAAANVAIGRGGRRGRPRAAFGHRCTLPIGRAHLRLRLRRQLLRRARSLPDHGLRIVAFIDALECRLAHVTLPCPSSELRSNDELGLDPDDVSQLALSLRRGIEGGRLRLELLEPPAELLPGPRREPGADLAREPQLVALVDANGHRPEVLRISLARRIATDDELLLRTDLDLQPGRRSATRLVSRATELGDDPFQLAALGRLVEGQPVGLDVRGESDAARSCGAPT